MTLQIRAIIFCVGCCFSCTVFAAEPIYSSNPQKSLFIGFQLGSATDLTLDGRRVGGADQTRKIAYTANGFLLSFSGGFRFTERWAFELGFRQSFHGAESQWGGIAGYQLFHNACRFALPTRFRQTYVFKLGFGVGNFVYGNVDVNSENRTLAIGGFSGISLEQELGLGIVALINVDYLPLYRKGMSGILVLEQYYPESLQVFQEIDRKDFTDSVLIHMLCISLGIQFEWIIR